MNAPANVVDESGHVISGGRAELPDQQGRISFYPADAAPEDRILAATLLIVLNTEERIRIARGRRSKAPGALHYLFARQI
jgi:hypothetical protein